MEVDTVQVKLTLRTMNNRGGKLPNQEFMSKYRAELDSDPKVTDKIQQFLGSRVVLTSVESSEPIILDTKED